MANWITFQVIELVYETLRATSPFKSWGLPDAESVEFQMTRHRDRRGHCAHNGSEAVIAIVAAENETLMALFETLAHEMCHQQQDRTHPRSAEHGVVFKRLSAKVRKHHPWLAEDF